jgi:hypothetical protein
MLITLISIKKILLGDQDKYDKYDIDPEALRDCKISGTILELDSLELNKAVNFSLNRK